MSKAECGLPDEACFAGVNEAMEREAAASPEPWCQAWREGIQPQLSTFALYALRDALDDDDKAIGQSVICRSERNTGRIVEACAIGYAGQAMGRQSVGAVMTFFQSVQAECERRTRAAFEEFVRWFDGTARQIVFAELLREVEAELVQRNGNQRKVGA